MEGIERIKNHILAETDRSVRTIEEETRQFVEKEALDSEEQSRRILSAAIERSEQDAGLLVKRAESLADAERRKRGLADKQKIVDEVIARALGKLSAQPAETRAARYAGWIHSLNIEEGVITLSRDELTSLGGALLAALPAGRFSIAEEAGNFSGGLIVMHGRVQDNLTYDLIIRDHRPELARLVLDIVENPGVSE